MKRYLFVWLTIVLIGIAVGFLTAMTWTEVEDNIGNELYYLDTNNLPGDLTGYVPPTGILTQTKVNRISDGEGSVITREVVIGGKTVIPALVFDNLPDTYTALATLYNQLRLDSLTAAQNYAALRDEALVLAGE